MGNCGKSLAIFGCSRRFHAITCVDNPSEPRTLMSKSMIASSVLKGKITVTMLLDVMRAFDNIARQRLLHNLRMKRFDEKLMRFINFFLSNKMTILKIDEYDIE